MKLYKNKNNITYKIQLQLKLKKYTVRFQPKSKERKKERKI